MKRMFLALFMLSAIGFGHSGCSKKSGCPTDSVHTKVDKNGEYKPSKTTSGLLPKKKKYKPSKKKAHG